MSQSSYVELVQSAHLHLGAVTVLAQLQAFWLLLCLCCQVVSCLPDLESLEMKNVLERSGPQQVGYCFMISSCSAVTMILMMAS